MAAKRKQKEKKREQTVTGLVLGILSLIFWLIPILGFPVSIVGLIFGINAVIKRKKFGTTALVFSIIGLILSIINAAFGVYFAMSRTA